VGLAGIQEKEYWIARSVPGNDTNSGSEMFPKCLDSGCKPEPARTIRDMLEQTQSLKKYFSIYVLLIIILTVIPIGNSLHLENTYIIDLRLDHILHAAMFIPWAFFCIKLKKYLPVWFFWGIMFSVFCEGFQYMLPYRSFNINDMLANMIGVVVGFFIFMPIMGKRFKL